MREEIALDTSVVIPIFENDLGIKEHLKGIKSLWMPVPVIAEIAVGLSDVSPFPSQKRDFEMFLASMEIIECTIEVAMKYGDIHRFLKSKGAMIPINDIWIAACCIVCGKPLATRDAHFKRIPGLDMEMW